MRLLVSIHALLEDEEGCDEHENRSRPAALAEPGCDVRRGDGGESGCTVA